MQHRGAISIHELVHIVYENRGFDIYTWDRGFSFLSRRKDLAGIAMQNPDTITTFVLHAALGRRGVDSDSPFREPRSDATKMELMGRRKIAAEEALGLAGFWLIAAHQALDAAIDHFFDNIANEGMAWNNLIHLQRSRRFIAELLGDDIEASTCGSDTTTFADLECTIDDRPISKPFENGNSLLPIDGIVTKSIAVINDASVTSRLKGPATDIEADSSGKLGYVSISSGSTQCQLLTVSGRSLSS